MFIKSIKLKNFRNYENINIDFIPKINIIYGNNAQGKTNLLESIYYLGLTKSHRSFNDNSLIKSGADTSIVTGLLNINDIDNKLEIIFNNSNKKLMIDNNEYKKISDYINKMKVIIFFPEDLELIKGAPQDRRRYLNIQISQLDNNYYNIINQYNKLLKIRNELLKECQKNHKIDESYFDIITNFMIDRQSIIYNMRNKYINKINDYINNIYKDISSYENFKIIYKTNIDEEYYNIENIKNYLKDKFIELKDVEKRAGTTLVGPHRDDIIFSLNDKDLKIYGSQGQQRIAVLALKLSEIEIFKKYCKDNPILLLDDVFSELDKNKRNNLLKYIIGNNQTIITTTDLDDLDSKILNESKLINIDNGKIVEVK